MTALISINNLVVELPSGRSKVRVLHGASFDVQPGEIIGLVGESGSGKSVTALAIMQLLPGGQRAITEGSILFKGTELTGKGPQDMRRIRGREISMIFQEPMTSLNPVFTVGRQIADIIAAHNKLSRGDACRQAVNMLSRVHIPDPERILKCYPHELSGGMRQRVMIAGALSCQPSLLIADEPTTALDVTIQAQILRLLKDAARNMGTAVLFITHDLGVVAQLCARVAVMYSGEIVEMGCSQDVLVKPRHPYTEALLRTVPDISRENQKLFPITGTVPDVRTPVVGCRFAPRCSRSSSVCVRQQPLLCSTGSGHQTACWHVMLGEGGI